MSEPDAAADRARTLGLILDGGRARRMGGADKGLLPLAGRPMIAHAIERLAPQVAALAVNANGDQARFATFGLPVVADDPPDFVGPLAGVLAGLEFAARARPALAYVATLPADTPFAPSDFVARLHATRRATRSDIAVAISAGRTHHVAALWPVALGAPLRRAVVDEGLRAAHGVAARFGVAFAEWPAEPVDPFMNVNTPEELALAEASLVLRSSRGGLP